MRHPRPLAERFWESVQKSDGCWLWTGSQNGRGYGAIGSGPRKGLRNLKAHRVSYELHYKCDVPSSLDVMHSCDNRLCVNPDHLSLGTRADNMQDAARKGRVCTIGKSRNTHCPRGHPLSGPNLYVTKLGHRKCRDCTRIHLLKYRQAIRS